MSSAGSLGGQLIDLFATLMLLVAFAMIAQRRVLTLIHLFAFQGATLVASTAVVGYVTHNCDASTIVHALHAGFAVEFLSDASGSVPYENSAGFASAQEIHRVYCVVLQSRFASVADTDTWLAALAAGEPLERSTIYASNQAARRRAVAMPTQA